MTFRDARRFHSRGKVARLELRQTARSESAPSRAESLLQSRRAPGKRSLSAKTAADRADQRAFPPRWELILVNFRLDVCGSVNAGQGPPQLVRERLNEKYSWDGFAYGRRVAAKRSDRGERPRNQALPETDRRTEISSTEVRDSDARGRRPFPKYVFRGQ